MNITSSASSNPVIEAATTNVSFEHTFAPLSAMQVSRLTLAAFDSYNEAGAQVASLSSASAGWSADEPESSLLDQCEQLRNVIFSPNLSENLQKAGQFFEYWRQIAQAPENVSERVLDQMGEQGASFQSLSELMKVQLLRKNIENMRFSVSFMVSDPVFKCQKKNGIRPKRTDVPGNLIGTAENPGVLIQLLEAHRSETTHLSDEEKTAISKIENCFLENIRLGSFSEDPQLRKSQYEGFAASLYLALHGKSSEEIDAMFISGEGSLCELPGVCFVGWKQRIDVHICSTEKHKGIKALRARFLEKRRSIVEHQISRELIQMIYSKYPERHYNNVHLLASVKQQFNDFFNLKYFPEELGRIELNSSMIIRNVLNEDVMKELGQRFLSVDTILQEVEAHFTSLSTDEKDELLEEVLKHFRKVCTISSFTLLDRLPDLSSLFDRIIEHNELQDTSQRTNLLKKDFDSLMNQYGIQPIVSFPQEITDLLQQLKRENKHNLPLARFCLSKASNPCEEIRSICTQHGIELDSEKTALLKRYDNLDIYRECIRTSFSRAILKKHVIEKNVELLKKVLVEYNHSSGNYQLTLAGKKILAGLTGQFRFYQSPDISLNSLYFLYFSLTVVTEQGLPKIDDEGLMKLLLEEGSEHIGMASERLLSDPSFMQHAIIRHPDLIFLFNSNSTPLNYRVLSAFQRQYHRDPMTLRFLLDAPCIFDGMPNKLAQVLNILLATLRSDLYSYAAGMFLRRSDDVINIMEHIKPHLLPTFLSLVSREILEHPKVEMKLLEVCTPDRYTDLFSPACTNVPVSLHLKLLDQFSQEQLKVTLSHLLRHVNLEDEVAHRFLELVSDQFLVDFLVEFQEVALSSKLIRQALSRVHPRLTSPVAFRHYFWHGSTQELDAWVVDRLQNRQDALQAFVLSGDEYLYPLLKAIPPALLDDRELLKMLFVHEKIAPILKFLYQLKDMRQIPAFFIKLVYHSLRTGNEPGVQQARFILRLMIHTNSDHLVKAILEKASNEVFLRVARHEFVAQDLQAGAPTKKDLVQKIAKLAPAPSLDSLVKVYPELASDGEISVDWITEHCCADKAMILLPRLKDYERSDMESALKLLQKMPGNCIYHVAKFLSLSLRRERTFIEEVIKITPRLEFHKLYKLMPKNHRNISFAHFMVSHCPEGFLNLLVAAFDQELKGDAEFMKELIEKVTPEEVGYFITLPDISVRTNLPFIYKALEKCPTLKLYSFFRYMSKELYQNRDLMDSLVGRAELDERRAILSLIKDEELKRDLYAKYLPEEFIPRKRQKSSS